MQKMSRTESTKECLKQLLAPVVALEVPVIGVGSSAQPTELQAVTELWPDVPYQMCQFHAKRERRATVLQCRSSREDRYAHQHARRNARISSQPPRASAGS